MSCVSKPILSELTTKHSTFSTWGGGPAVPCIAEGAMYPKELVWCTIQLVQKWINTSAVHSKMKPGWLAMKMLISGKENK